MVPETVAAQTVTGVVRELVSKQPIQAADIRFKDAEGGLVAVGVSGDDGRFSFRLPAAGIYLVEVSRIGFSPAQATLVEVAKGEELDLTAELAVRPLPIEPLTVEVTGGRIPQLEREGVYRRAEQNPWGTYLFEEGIRRKVATRITDLFYGIPYWRVVQSGHEWDLVRRGRKPTIVIDGYVVRRCDADRTAPWADLVHPSDIKAMEVYDGPAGVPVQYQLGRGCPVVLIWTG